MKLLKAVFSFQIKSKQNVMGFQPSHPFSRCSTCDLTNHSQYSTLKSECIGYIIAQLICLSQVSWKFIEQFSLKCCTHKIKHFEKKKKTFIQLRTSEDLKTNIPSKSLNSIYFDLCTLSMCRYSLCEKVKRQFNHVYYFI